MSCRLKLHFFYSSLQNSFPAQPQNHYGTMPHQHAKTKVMEIPVQHDLPSQKMQGNQNWPQQQQPMQYPQQYPQSKSPPRVSTPPRVGTPPRNQTQTESKFFTLPRNHKERAPEFSREIPIQHFSSRPGQPSNQSQSDVSYPQPDYPGAPMNQQQVPQQQQFGGQPAPNQGHNMYPNFSQGFQYPQQQGQSFPYPASSTFGQQGQSPYPQYSAPQPQPNVHPAGQGFPQPMQQGQQMPQQPATPQGQNPEQPPMAQCPPPMREQHVEFNIPIIREEASAGPQPDSQQQAGFQTWPRQPKQPQQQQFSSPQPNVTATAERTSAPDRSREQTPGNGMDHTDYGSQQQQPKTDQQQHVPQQPNGQSHGKPAQKTANTPLDVVHTVLTECQQYKDRVNNFSGGKKSKEYKILEEMLTRSLLKLDGVESGNDLSIRQARRAAVKEVQSYLDQLELKGFSEAAPMPENNGAKSDTSNYASGPEQMDTSSQKEGAPVKEMLLESEVSC